MEGVFWGEDPPGEDDGGCTEYICADGETVPIFFEEKHWEIIREAESDLPECLLDETVGMGGGIIYLQPVMFENNMCL